MNFILDENVSLGLANRLRISGHDVISIAEEPNRGFEDDDIFHYAKKLSQYLLQEIITLQTPFVFLLKTQKALFTSVMVI